MLPSPTPLTRRARENFVFISGDGGEVSLPPASEIRVCVSFSTDSLAIELRPLSGRSEKMVLPPRGVAVVDRKVAAEVRWIGVADILVISLGEKVLAETARNLGLPKVLPSGPAKIADPVIQNIAGMVRDLFVRDHELPGQVAASATQLLAVRFLGHVDSKLPESKRERLSPSALRRAMEFIDHHLIDEFDLEDMANAAGCSRFHFARAFRSATGVPPWRYVTGCRLKQAEKLLRMSEKLSVAEVCHMAGFQDQSHFTRAFKNAFSVTPGNFRRSLVDKAA